MQSSIRTKAFPRGEGGMAPMQYDSCNGIVWEYNKRLIYGKLCGAVTEEGK